MAEGKPDRPQPRRSLLSTSPFRVNSSTTGLGGNPRSLGLSSPGRFLVPQPRGHTLGLELEVTPEPVVQVLPLWGRWELLLLHWGGARARPGSGPGARWGSGPGSGAE